MYCYNLPIHTLQTCFPMSVICGKNRRFLTVAFVIKRSVHVTLSFHTKTPFPSRLVVAELGNLCIEGIHQFQ